MNKFLFCNVNKKPKPAKTVSSIFECLFGHQDMAMNISCLQMERFCFIFFEKGMQQNNGMLLSKAL